MSGPTSGGLGSGMCFVIGTCRVVIGTCLIVMGRRFLTASRWSSGTAQNARNRCEDLDCMKLLKRVFSNCYLT